MSGVFESLISRVDAAGLIPPPAVLEIQEAVAKVSISLGLMRQLPMSTGQAKVPIASELPHAYWVNGDTGLKQTTKAAWDGRILTAEEIAVLVPVPEQVLADTSRDLWALIRPRLADAIAAKLDDAVVFGVDRPATFAQAIVPAAEANDQAFTDPDVIAAVDQALGALEERDVSVTGVAARATFRSSVRRALHELGGAAQFAPAPPTLYGYQLSYPSGSVKWPSGLQAIVGDFDSALIGVRQDITYRLLDQAVISDDEGRVIFNLPQQDSVALRAVARYAFQVADTIYQDGDGETQRAYPFATAGAAA